MECELNELSVGSRVQIWAVGAAVEGVPNSVQTAVKSETRHTLAKLDSKAIRGCFPIAQRH